MFLRLTRLSRALAPVPDDRAVHDVDQRGELPGGVVQGQAAAEEAYALPPRVDRDDAAASRAWGCFHFLSEPRRP